jgi:hypothetical protein
MGGLVMAWMFGESLIVYRWFKHKAPPPPGALIEASALFVALAILAEYQPARQAATLFAWGIDLAVLLKLIGKEPAVTTNWPPLCIPDTQLMPSRTGGVPCGQGQAAGGSAKTTGTATPTAQLDPGTPKIRPSGVHI